jgi:hypothetical protein
MWRHQISKTHPPNVVIKSAYIRHCRGSSSGRFPNRPPTQEPKKRCLKPVLTTVACLIPLNQGQDRMKILTSGKTVSRLRSASKRRQIEEAATRVYPLGPSIKEEAVARTPELLS